MPAAASDETTTTVASAFRRECLARMLTAVERNHDVTADALGAARGQRNRAFDVAVSGLFLPLYLLGGIAASRWLSRRLATLDRFVRLIAAAILSVAFSFLGLQVLRLWGTVWEVIRVGNGHMSSMRAASQSRWMDHVDGQLVEASCCSGSSLSAAPAVRPWSPQLRIAIHMASSSGEPA